MSLIDLVVDQMHVGTSNRDIIREFRGRFIKRCPEATKAQRKEVYRAALKRHKENRELYTYVMRGAPKRKIRRGKNY